MQFSYHCLLQRIIDPAIIDLKSTRINIIAPGIARSVYIKGRSNGIEYMF